MEYFGNFLGLGCCKRQNFVKPISKCHIKNLKFSILLNVQNGSDLMCYLCSPTICCLTILRLSLWCTTSLYSLSIKILGLTPLILSYLLNLKGVFELFFFTFFFPFVLPSLSTYQPWHSFMVKVYIVINI